MFPCCYVAHINSLDATYVDFFNANKPYLVNRNVAMGTRFRYVNAVVTPVACFGAAHGKVYKQDLCKMDIVFRRLLRSFFWVYWWRVLDVAVAWTFSSLGRANEIFYSASWLENMVCCLLPTILPTVRWVGRTLNWLPEKCSTSWPVCFYTWDSMIQYFCRLKQVRAWGHRAHDSRFWMNQLDALISLTEICWLWHVNIVCFALVPHRGWLKRVLHWNPCGRRRVGRPKHAWDSDPRPFLPPKLGHAGLTTDHCAVLACRSHSRSLPLPPSSSSSSES